MATSARDLGGLYADSVCDRQNLAGDRRVDRVGTMIEWYDFYIFGSLARLFRRFFIRRAMILSLISLIWRHSPSALSCVRSELIFRTNRRYCRAQICFSGHALDYGRSDRDHRIFADLRANRHCRTDYFAVDSRAARFGSRRRIRRCGGLCRRTRSR